MSLCLTSRSGVLLSFIKFLFLISSDVFTVEFMLVFVLKCLPLCLECDALLSW